MECTSKAQYTIDHLNALKLVRDGADVFDYVVAIRLREVQRITPEWIEIGKAQGTYRAVDTLPYFGAILTPAGVEGLNDACWESLKQDRKSY